MNPFRVFIGREAGSGSDEPIAIVGRRGELAVTDVERPQADAPRVALKHRGEHVPIITRDVAELFEVVVAFEQTDIHKKVFACVMWRRSWVQSVNREIAEGGIFRFPFSV